MSLMTVYQDLKGRLSLRLRGHRSELLAALLKNDIRLLETQARQMELMTEIVEESRKRRFSDSAEEPLRDISAQLTTLRTTVVYLNGRLDRIDGRMRERECAPSPNRFRLQGRYSSTQIGNAPEPLVLKTLFPFLQHPVALDVGAHHGVFSQALFDAGYTVHAFEPYPPSAEVLRRRFGGESRVTVHELALSDRNGRQPFHLVAVQGEEQPTQDSSYFHRLEVLELPAGLHMPNALEVETSRLDSLWEKGVLPERIGVLKVDAEGMDPRILASLPDNRIPVVLAEFHEQGHAFHPVDTSEQELMSMLSCMRDKGYFWHILFRYHAVPGAGDAYEVTAEFCQPACGDDSWGNVMFFSTYELYQIVREWCRAAGRPVYDSMDSGG